MSTNIFISLLREMGVSHTHGYATRLFENHPFKYTFYGLKSLCETYGISAEGVNLKDKDEIGCLPTPFIADYAHDFVLVNDASSEDVKFEVYGISSRIALEQFKNEWGGRALLFKKSKKSIEPDYIKHKLGSFISKLEWGLLAVGIIAILFYSMGNVETVFSYSKLSQIVLSLLGLSFSAMLIMQQLKVQNAFIQNICHAFKKSSCNNVLESNASKVLNRYSWSEIGFSYFFVNTLFLLYSNQSEGILVFVNAAALLFSIWSIWYQMHISQWCPLCILVQVIIFIQFLVYLLRGTYMQISNVLLDDMAVLFLAYISTGIVVNKLSSLFVQPEKLQHAEWKYIHLKMNPIVYKALMGNEESFMASNSSILFGCKDSGIRITVLSNPYCNPCSVMHKRLQKLVETKKCQVQYVFTSFKPEWNDINKFLIAVYMHFGADKTWSIYTKWYKDGKLANEKFFEDYHLDITNGAVEDEFNKHESWVKETNLDETPTILINNRKLPYGYEVEDFLYM